VIVQFKLEAREMDISPFLTAIDATVQKDVHTSNVKMIDLPESITVEDAVLYFSGLDIVVYAEPNYIRTLHYSPTDPLYSYQWHLSNMNMEIVWDVTTGNSGVVVAVLDTGVAYENYNGFLKAPDLVGTNFVPGYDFVGNDSHPNDEGSQGFGHGTHVSGVIAQATNNGIGTVGAAFGCSIMPIRVCSGGCSDANIAAGIRWAADHGADVINMSFGGYGSSATLSSAIEYAYGMGVVLIASSGNEAEEVWWQGDVAFPAGHENVLAVGATRYDNKRSYYSSYGRGLDVVAPGGDVTVDQNGDNYGDGILQNTFATGINNFGYYFAQGTSFSAPNTAALAALLMSYESALKGKPDLIYDIIRYSTTDLGTEGKDNYYGWGIINPYNALIGLGLLD